MCEVVILDMNETMCSFIHLLVPNVRARIIV